MNMFVLGLGRMNAAGQDVFGTLGDLGLSEIRTRDALLRLSSAGDLLTNSLDDGARAWDENRALLEEAERRYGTVEARMQTARNQLNDFAIDIGQTFLPVAGAMADTIGAVADMFGALPGPVQTVLGVLGAVAAAILLTGGAALAAAPRIVAYREAMDHLAASGGRAATMVGGVRRATGALAGMVGFLGGPWGAALAVGAVAIGAFAHQQGEAKRQAEQLQGALDQQNGAVTENARLLVANALAAEEFRFNNGTSAGTTVDFAEALEMANVEMATAVEAATGNGAALRELQMRLSEAAAAYQNGTDVTGEYAAGTEEARQASLDQWHMLQLIIGVVTETGGAVDAAGDRVRALSEATGQSTDELANLDPQARATAESLGLTADEARDLTVEAEALGDALDGLFESMFGVEEAEDAAAEALRRLVEEAENGQTALAGNSEEALNNRDNVRALIQAHMDQITAMAEAGASAEDLQGATEDLRESFIEQMEQAGFSEEAIRHYAAAYDLIPAEVATAISTPGMTEAERRLRNLRVGIDNVPRNVNVNVSWSMSGTLPGTGGMPNIAFRHGGVTTYRAQSGLLRHPSVFTPRAPARFAFAEPATGGEAFVPRLGDRRRSLAIADVAARWHGGRVVAGDGANLGGQYQWHGQRTAGSAMAGSGGGVVALTAEDRALLREVAERPVELRTNDEVIARSNDRGQRVLARRR
ncbi:MAG TPA: phage tail tape measure protein, partial [Candidatus Limnocylindrales bacterium]